MNPRILCCLALALFAGGCQTRSLWPNAELIAPWTAALQDAQPDGPVAAVYIRDGRRLVFIAAHHENTTDSATFRIIEDAFAEMRFDTLIAEGAAYSGGPNDPSTLAWLARQEIADGFVAGGEFVPAARSALAQGARIFGGEPSDAEILSRMRAEGFTAEDVLGFYVLRNIPQWERERRIENAGDERLEALVGPALQRDRTSLGIGANVLPGPRGWRDWYEARNGKPLDASFEIEEVGPRSDGRFATNRIGAAIGRARDAFLLQIIARHLNQGESVVVLFGQSHFMMLQPALSDMLGPACYVGSTLRAARC